MQFLVGETVSDSRRKQQRSKAVSPVNYTSPAGGDRIAPAIFVTPPRRYGGIVWLPHRELATITLATMVASFGIEALVVRFCNLVPANCLQPDVELMTT